MTTFKNIGLIGAGAVGSAALVMGAAGLAGAQEDDPTLDSPAPAEDTAPGEGHRHNHQARVQAMVDQLVEDGVITTDQVDDWQAVRDALHEQRRAQRVEKLQGIADVLGVTVEDLQEARANGESLVDIAGDDLDALVDYLTDQATARIEAAVEDGRITREQADERLDGLEERIQDRIENDGFGGRRGHRDGGRRGFGPGGAGGPAADLAEASLT